MLGLQSAGSRTPPAERTAHMPNAGMPAPDDSPTTHPTGARCTGRDGGSCRRERRWYKRISFLVILPSPLNSTNAVNIAWRADICASTATWTHYGGLALLTVAAAVAFTVAAAVASSTSTLPLTYHAPLSRVSADLRISHLSAYVS